MRGSSMFVSSIAETFSQLPAADITQKLYNTVRMSEPPRPLLILSLHVTGKHEGSFHYHYFDFQRPPVFKLFKCK